MPADYSFSPRLRSSIKHNLANFRPRLSDTDGLRRAAVGVVLLPDANDRTCFVLTRRLSTLRRHAGQWALPGGRLEPGETPEQAAIREIREEINLELSREALLGQLDDFETRSGHLISPFVLWSADASALVASPHEVDAMFRVPLGELDHPDALRLEPLLHFVMPSLTSTVHAPTAAMLYQFREVALHGREVRVADVEQPYFAWH